MNLVSQIALCKMTAPDVKVMRDQKAQQKARKMNTEQKYRNAIGDSKSTTMQIARRLGIAYISAYTTLQRLRDREIVRRELVGDVFYWIND